MGRGRCRCGFGCGLGSGVGGGVGVGGYVFGYVFVYVHVYVYVYVRLHVHAKMGVGMDVVGVGEGLDPCFIVGEGPCAIAGVGISMDVEWVLLRLWV